MAPSGKQAIDESPSTENTTEHSIADLADLRKPNLVAVYRGHLKLAVKEA